MEFGRAEPEVAFAQLPDEMELAEQSLSPVAAVPMARWAELHLLARDLEKFEHATAPFPRITHEEARCKKNFWRLFHAIIFRARRAAAWSTYHQRFPARVGYISSILGTGQRISVWPSGPVTIEVSIRAEFCLTSLSLVGEFPTVLSTNVDNFFVHSRSKCGLRKLNNILDK